MSHSIRDTGQGEYWDDRAKQYSNQYGLSSGFNKIKVRRKVQMANQYVSLHDPVKLLEVGCGTGIFTAELARINDELVAVDISPKMMAIAIKQCSSIRFAQMDGRNLGLASNVFDVVFSAFLLQHVHVKSVLMEMHRVLKSGGYMIAFVPNILNPIHYGRAKNVLYRTIFKETSQSEDFTRWQWSRILKSSGYEEIIVKPISFDSPHTPKFLTKIVMFFSNVLERIPVIKEFAGSLMIIGRKI